MWANLNEVSPETAFFVQAFSISDNQMTKLLNSLYRSNQTIREVACQWVIENEQIWENWVRPSKYKKTLLFERFRIK
jgi:ABC-type proline/glycine betaine transport system substrate-binding protein